MSLLTATLNKTAISILFAAIICGMTAGTSFALPSGTLLSFSDTVNNPTSPLNWTHTLENADFTPNLDPFDRFNVTDAELNIQMDLTLGNFIIPRIVRMGLIEVLAFGDSIYLGVLDVYDAAPGTTYNDYLWTIDLGGNQAALNAIKDKALSVSLLVNPFFGGTINHVDYATLSGKAVVTPEPGTLLLLGSGLLALGFSGRKFRNRKKS